MKYRIVVNTSKVYPYSVEVGTKIFWVLWDWCYLSMHATVEDAQSAIKKDIYYRTRGTGIHGLPEEGTIISEYDMEDYLVDKLKDKV